MNKEIYKTLINPATKEFALEAIKRLLNPLTSTENIIQIITDTKSQYDRKLIRATVFVQDLDRVSMSKIKRVEEKLKQNFGIKFQLVFCNAFLTHSEQILLSSVKPGRVINFVDLENFAWRSLPESKKINNIKNLFNQTLGLEKEHTYIICANFDLINTTKEVLKEVNCDNLIFIQTGGKDCSDLRLVQSIQKLNDLKKLEKYETITIASGDGFFNSIIDWLENKNFTLNIFGQLNKAHHNLVSRPNFVPLNEDNKVISKL
jgi:hypothetical protein